MGLDDLEVPDFDFDEQEQALEQIGDDSDSDMEVNSDSEGVEVSEEEKDNGEGVTRSEVVFAAAPVSTSIPEHLKTHMQWSELRLSRPFLKALNEMGFAEPTPIQRDAIPKAMEGRDIMATAETGSGKTAAFLLPILERLMLAPAIRGRKRLPDGRITSTGVVGTRALVLLPTRELAQQCFAMLKGLTKHAPITSVVIAGGFEMREQERILRQQPDIVVATPGRILDMLTNAQGVHMELLEVVVFDEADRLLELGFKEECMNILKHCAPQRQTLMFSATFNEKVTDLAAVALSKPIRVSSNKVSKVARTIEQEFLELSSENFRDAALVHLVTDRDSRYKDRTIIFFATKQAAHRAYIVFQLLKIKCTELHGNLTQQQRSDALKQFSVGEVGLLLATDVAARGLDIPDVDHVINVTVPMEASRYVHRVGRCGRIGRSGHAITLYVPSERPQLKGLAKAAVPDSTGNDSKTACERKLLTRKLNEKVLGDLPTQISGLERSIKKWIGEEVLEKEVRVAEMELRKANNMITYKDEISARPKKEWFMTSKEKRQMNEASKELAQQAADIVEKSGKKSKGGNKRAREEERTVEKQRRGERETTKKRYTAKEKMWHEAKKIVMSGAKNKKRKTKGKREHELDI